MRTSLFFAFLFYANLSFGQSRNDTIAVKFRFNKIVTDSSDLTLRIYYTNRAKRTIYFYPKLVAGDAGDRFTNITFYFQRKTEDGFRLYTTTFYNSRFRYSLTDRHYDPPKKEVPVGSTDSLSFNFLEIAGFFEAGEYRFIAHLRVNTKPDNSHYDDKTGAKGKPEDTLEYISSK